MNNKIQITEEELEIIEQFLSGQLAGHDLNLFENRMEKEADWKEKVEWVELTKIGINEASLSAELKSQKVNADNAIVKNFAGNRFLLLKVIAGLAAVSLAILITFWSLGVFKSGHEKLFASYYQPDSGLITSMGVSDSYEFEVAMIDYKSEKYKEAIDKWMPLLQDNENNDTLQYFLGNSYLAMGQTDKAIESFKRVLEKANGTFRDDAHWYLGLALIKENRISEAIEEIEMSANPRKEKLLEKLRK